jgi:hypothetical protein
MCRTHGEHSVLYYNVLDVLWLLKDALCSTKRAAQINVNAV